MALRLLWPPSARLQALLAMHVALDTHATLPHLTSLICAPPFPAAPVPTDAPSSPALPTEPFFSPTNPSHAAASRDASGAGECRERDTGGGEPTAPLLGPEAAALGHMVGWARAGLPWWRFDGVRVWVAMDLASPDDVWQLQRLCVFHRACATGSPAAGDAPRFFMAASVGGTAVPDDALRRLVSIEQVCAAVLACECTYTFCSCSMLMGDKRDWWLESARGELCLAEWMHLWKAAGLHVCLSLKLQAAAPKRLWQ